MGSRHKHKIMDEASSHVEIPVWLRGTQRWVNGLTKRTTCDDVIYAVLYSEDRHENESTDKYTIYERWRDVERPLQGRTKILKIWRAWGAEQCNVQLTMKHNDEPDEFGDFLHSRHRHKRVRYHRTRDDRERHSKRKHKSNESTTDRLKSMENLAKLVINQERQLHNIMHRIESTERKISQHENRMHNTRVEENGEDYVQNAYLNEMCNGDNNLENSMDEFLKNVNPENWEMYLQFCDKVINIDGKLLAENAKIDNLSHEIQEHSLNEGFYSNYISGSEGHVTGGGNMEDELSHLQADLNRIVSANMMQKYQAAEISKEIEVYDKMLQDKQETIKELQRELEYVETCEQNMNKVREEDSIVLTIANKKQSAPISDLYSDYVNIDAILGWKESMSSSSGDAWSYAPEVVVHPENSLFQSKRSASDIDDSFSTDTDLTSNDSQFGSSKTETQKPHHSTPNTQTKKSLDNDDIISERIKSEMYTFQKGRGCHIKDKSANCSSIDLNRTLYCAYKHRDDDSDTGLSSMHSDEASSSSYLETLV